MRGKGTISFPPWNSFLENWSKKNPHSSSEPRKFSSRLLLSRRWAVAGNNVFRAERGREGRGGERAAGLPPPLPARPPTRLSIRRTDVRQRVTLSAALALIHVGDAECYGNRRNKKRNGGEPPSPPPPPPLAPRRSTMNLLHDRQSIRRGGGSGGFSPTESSSDEHPIRRPRPDG